MSLTQSTPWNDWARVTRGDALQDSSLVNSEGQVFRTHEDHGFFVNRWLRALRKKEEAQVKESKWHMNRSRK